MKGHIINTRFTASKPGCPNIIKGMFLVRQAIRSKLFFIKSFTFPLYAIFIWLSLEDRLPAEFPKTMFPETTAMFPKHFQTQTEIQLATLKLTFTALCLYVLFVI